MKQNARFVFAVLAAMLLATPALPQNTGRTGGGNRPLASRSVTQVADKANASITNSTGSPVTITLDPGDEAIRFQAGETREVSCSQKVFVGKVTDAAKAINLTCQANYQMRASGGNVEIVLTSMP